jgi:hypothetical protein
MDQHLHLHIHLPVAPWHNEAATAPTARKSKPGSPAPDSAGQALVVLVNFGTSALTLYAPNEFDDEDTLTVGRDRNSPKPF